MVSDPDFPAPASFNPFKHHRDFILKTVKNTPLETLKKMAGALNNNYIDIYTGQLEASAVCDEIIDYLGTNRVLEKECFSRWITGANGYKLITLSDQSAWIVRFGINDLRYVHVHPSKSGPYSARIKGSTLKTFYVLTKKTDGDFNNLTLEVFNKTRFEIGLSPVKRPAMGIGFQKCRELFDGSNF